MLSIFLMKVLTESLYKQTENYLLYIYIRRDYDIIESASKYDDMYTNSIKINNLIRFFLHDVPPFLN